MGARFLITLGDISEARTEVVVNAWNRNFIPYWLLPARGVARALRKKAGLVPFRELRRFGLLQVGDVVETSAGKMTEAKAIFHVAALHAYWSSSPEAISRGAKNLFALAASREVQSIAIPLFGSGTGRIAPEQSFELIAKAWEDARAKGDAPGRTEIYVYDAILYQKLLDEYFRASAYWNEGLDCLGRKEYWEAHEAWEEIWSILPDSVLRRVLQALIQFAAACYKPEQILAKKTEAGMQRGMAALIRTASEYLNDLESGGEEGAPQPGFELESLHEGIDALREVQRCWQDGELTLERVEEKVADIAMGVANKLRGQPLIK